MKFIKRLSFGSLVLMLIVLSVATVIEKVNGADVAKKMIYHSWVFATLWLFIAIMACIHLFNRKLFKRSAVFLLHISLLLILLGAGVTWLFSLHGKMSLMRQEQVNAFTTDGNAIEKLPFDVELTDFNIQYYAGTRAPMDFISKIKVIDKDRAVVQGQVSMNKVFSHQGYRFFQSGYDPEGNGTVFSVQYDPWGIGISYTGYFLLIISSILVLFEKRGHFRQLLRSSLLKQSATAVALLFCSFTASSQTEVAHLRVLPQELAEKLGDTYILYNDRMCPFETFARDFTMKMYGSNSFNGYSATQVVSGWIFYFEDWKDAPMIKVKASVQNTLGIRDDYASFQDFVSTQNEYKLEGLLSQIMQGNDVANAKDIREADEKYELASMMAMGELTRIFPLNINGELQWFTPVSNDIPLNIDENKLIFISQGLNFLNELVAKNDMHGAADFLIKFKEYQIKEGGKLLPSTSRFKAEKLYNSLYFSKPLGMTLVVIGMILFFFMVRRIATKKLINKSTVIGINALLVLMFLYLTLLIGLRWWISRHLPLSNGPETMEFMSWSAVLLALLLQRRFSMILAFGTLIAGLTLMVSSFGNGNPQLTQLMPVLQSPLLSVHVVVIMIAYSLLAFIMLNGIAAVALRKNAEQTKRLHVIGQIMLYPAVFLLAAGVFVGAVWANVSWGTYWSWDPKEVWALITLVIYALPLHVGSLPKFSKPMFFHIYAIIAFLSVLITYFGVNFLLGGMHSYA